jgi:ubiquitin-like modifier-activating enzyme ATG7
MYSDWCLLKDNIMTSEDANLVRFLPFRSVAEPSFWLDHNSRKLNELRLSEEGIPLRGFFGVSTATIASSNNALAPGMRFDTSGNARRNEWIRAHGTIHSLNTIEALKRCDKNQFLNEACLPHLLTCCGILEADKNSGGASNNLVDPNVALIPVACLTYCDLKNNMTVYWFAFPALSPRKGCAIAYSTKPPPSLSAAAAAAAANNNNHLQTRLVDTWGAKECRNLSKCFHNLRLLLEEQQQQQQQLDDKITTTNNNDVWCPPFFLLLPTLKDVSTGAIVRKMKCLPFNKETFTSLSDDEKQCVIFGFVDPNTTTAEILASSSSTSATLAVGWTLRNLVAYLSLCLGLGGTDVTFLSFRLPFLRRVDSSSLERSSSSSISDDDNDGGIMNNSYIMMDVGDDEFDMNDEGVGNSLLLHITIPLASDYKWNNNGETSDNIYTSYRCVGWEVNKNNKPGPRSIDLRPLVSPSHLARQANDLNLRLMKWRALPTLDVQRLSQLKVVLLGAGTLGCSVARTLLGWGVRKITFVDSGRVSYSNPVRQSLFGIEDCKDGGKYKAVAAADSLVAIAGPDVESEGVVLTIPMPGHPFGGGKDGEAETAAVKKDAETLHKLIADCDVVFLLTDTRESRWLPTVIALATDTPLINAALGLDSWLVMRHGPSSSALASWGQSQRLGCYFCNDIVAPENSTRDRTLDQQCTVTRPGLAPIAASMATELCVAMFHHSLGQCAPAPEARDGGAGAYAPVDDGTSPSSSPLGLVPHQIRGTVVTYMMMTPSVPAFPSCTGCGESVVDEYKKGGFEFCKRVCCDADGTFLEKVSGLTAFREEAAKKMDECFDWDDSDVDA